MVCSLSPACFSQCSKPSRIGWFASCIAWTRCSYVWASLASVMEPLSLRSAVLLPPVSPSRQDRLAILDGMVVIPQQGRLLVVGVVARGDLAGQRGVLGPAIAYGSRATAMQMHHRPGLKTFHGRIGRPAAAAGLILLPVWGRVRGVLIVLRQIRSWSTVKQ